MLGLSSRWSGASGRRARWPGARPGCPDPPAGPEREADPGAHEAVPAEQDRDGGIAGRGRERRQPGIPHALREEQVARESVLGRRPAPVVLSEPVREEHASVDESAVGELGEMPPQVLGAVPIEEQAEHRPRGPPVGAPEQRGGGRGAQTPLLHQGADPARRPLLQPAQVPHRRPPGDEQLGPGVAAQRVQRLEPGGDSVPKPGGNPGQETRDDPLEQEQVQRSVDVDREPAPVGQVANGDPGRLREPPGKGVVGGQVVRKVPERKIGARHRHDIRRVPVVGERGGLVAACGDHEIAQVAVARQRHRPRAQDDHARGIEPGEGGPKPAPERCKVWRPAPDVERRRPGSQEAGPVARDDRLAGIAQEALQGPGTGTGPGVEHEDRDGQHPSSLAMRRVPPLERIRAYVGLGANVGDAAATLAAAVHALGALPAVRLCGVSRLYATEPVGVLDQPEFRNAVVALDVPAGRDPETGAVALLMALKDLERAFGRQVRERWGPREVDLDLLLFGPHRIETGRPPAARSEDPGKADLPLVVPHREARERLFVLAPLADLAPDLVPPGWDETVAAAAARRQRIEGDDAARPIADWDGERWDMPA
jgi:2-amino-4-hydroxy-6-hydroxymethyldihydropteridine diphosphokinase